MKFCKKCGHPLYQEGGEENRQDQRNRQDQWSRQDQQGQWTQQNQWNKQNQWNQNGSGSQKSYQPIQIFAIVMCVILGWFFLQNGVPSVYHIITSFFRDLFDGFHFLGFGSLLGANLLRLLQAASFALMAAVMFTVFTRWKDEKASEFILTTIISGALVAVVGLIRFLIFTLPYMKYGYTNLTWLIWIFVMAAISIGGIIGFTASMGLPVSPVRMGEAFSDAVKDSFHFVSTEFLDELRELQEKNANKNKNTNFNGNETAGGPQYGAGQNMYYVGPLKTNYSFLAYLFLGWITCGIYDLYLIYCISRDINITGQGDGENTPGLLAFILLSWVTCGIYQYIYFYKLGNRIQRTGNRYGLMVQENGTTILLWYLLGILTCSIGVYIAIYIVFSNMNKVNDAYNRSMGMQ